MKKLLLIFTLLISHLIFSQKGYWLCKSYKVIDSTLGWRTGEMGLLLDFTNSKILHLAKDTSVNITIDRKNRKITNKTKSEIITYQVKKNTIEIKNNNIINVFYPFEIKKGKNFSKEKILKKLVSSKIKPIKDSLKICFTNSKNWKTKNNSNIRVLKTQFLKNDSQKSEWFIEKIENNLILGFNSLNEPSKFHYYRIIDVFKNSIILETIIEYDFLLNLKKIEFEK